MFCEEAARKALVERYTRDRFTVAAKFPTFMLIPEEKIEETFQSQLDNLGVDYIDYYSIFFCCRLYLADIVFNSLFNDRNRKVDRIKKGQDITNAPASDIPKAVSSAGFLYFVLGSDFNQTEIALSF